MADDVALPPMRPHMEIQRAHDILTDVLAGELRQQFDPDTLNQMTAALHGLCWVLNHANDTFGVNLQNLIALAASHGIIWELDATGDGPTTH